MNPFKTHWLMRLLLRTVLHTLCGAACAGIVGALCVAGAGALTGAIIDIGGTPFRWNEGLMPLGFCIGIALGGIGGILVGALIHAIRGLLGAPGPQLLPSRASLRTISLGQIGATASLCAFSLTLETLLSLIQGRSLPALVDQHLFWIMWSTPALMMCGAIAGAVWQRPSRSAAR